MDKELGIGITIVTVTVAVFVVVGVEVALLPSYLLLPPHLPLPHGTVIHLRWTYTDPWEYHFVVSQPPGRLVGAWISNGEVGAMVLPGNATTPIPISCPAMPVGGQLGPPSAGSFNDSLGSGWYTLVFACAPGQPDVTVTQTIQVAYT